MSDLTIRALIERVTSGDIRIPAFQRDFVWEPDQVAFLIDSIYKNFPIGTVVFWQTDERLNTEKKLGSFELPEPRRDYPVNYVLDGQQRITSLFSVFQTELTPSDTSWVDVYFDMNAANNPQDSSFVALDESEVDWERHFPIKTFFDTIGYRNATKNLGDERAALVDDVQAKFKEYRIQNQTFETQDRNEVAIVFERINRAGTELDLFELLAAWSWSDDFDLIEKFKELQDKISEHGYEELTDERDLQLRTCAAVITGETSPNKILDLQGDDIRSRFIEIESGILGAIDFLKRELGVLHFKMLPFPGILVPLSTFFATAAADGVNYSDKQKEVLIKWFWRSVFTRRFSADVSERQANDIREMHALRNDENHEFRFPSFEIKFDFRKARFSAGNANSKATVLMLANRKPHSFLSGATIDTSKVLKKGSRHEFHHIFPRKHLERQGYELRDINSIANICFLTRSDNNTIKAKSPEVYFDDMSEGNRDQYLKEALCEYNDKSLSYEEFLELRSERLINLAYELAGEAYT
ncbi:GmrSD restriction endonuclease domain-containing protein [Roseovarius pacificus]|uniref:GmrSD restriction endonuclease domain-containing protein n=1 Tax=Roseovarius pacificus TaxID=337701 RepID=UPI004039A207